MSTLILGFTVNDLVSAVLLLPFLGALLSGLIFIAPSGIRQKMQPLVTTLGVGCPALTFLFILLISSMLDGAREGIVLGPYFHWIPLQAGMLDVAFLLDPLSLSLGLFGAGATVLIALYTLGLEEPRDDLTAFFSLWNFGLFFLLLVSWSDNLPLLFVGWEGLALLSFVVLSYSGEAGVSNGARASFWLSRIGTVLFLVALFGLMNTLSGTDLDDSKVLLTFAFLQEQQSQIQTTQILCLIVPALFFAAQLPASLYLWQAGKGKLSSILWIYCLGTVTAGIYFLCRLQFLTMADPLLLLLLELLGGATCLIAALLSVFQNSLRRVLAYVTVSQAGFVISALGFGAVQEGLTHWFFSALSVMLLLFAGGILWRIWGEDDFTKFGGMRFQMPLILVALLVGGASLVGIFPSAGFFSRYEILWQAFTQERYFTWVLIASGSVITAISITRFVATACLGGQERDLDQEKIRQPITIQLSLFTAAIGSLVAIWLGLPKAFYGQDVLNGWLLSAFEDYLPIRSEAYGPSVYFGGAVLVLAVLLLAIVLTVFLCQRRQENRRRTSWLWNIAENDAYLEIAAKKIFVRPLEFLTKEVMVRFIQEEILEGIIFRGFESGLRFLGRGFLRLQTGSIHHYLLWCLLGSAILFLLLL